MQKNLFPGRPVTWNDQFIVTPKVSKFISFVKGRNFAKIAKNFYKLSSSEDNSKSSENL